MAHLTIDGENGLFYRHTPPAKDKGATFVFVNALTGTADHWDTVVSPRLHNAGHGTLSYNFRGQQDSPFRPGLALTPDLIVSDLERIVKARAPVRPILVGLSIGGLFAAQAVQRGLAVNALVLLNTLREIGPRIGWINDALPLIMAYGGAQLFSDAILPLLVNPEYLGKVRAQALKGQYAPMDPEHGHSNLMRHSPRADWDFDWSVLRLPVLSITGLCDRVFLDRDIVEKLGESIPNLCAENWADCGHLVPLERPERLAKRLIAFGDSCGIAK